MDLRYYSTAIINVHIFKAGGEIKTIVQVFGRGVKGYWHSLHTVVPCHFLIKIGDIDILHDEAPIGIPVIAVPPLDKKNGDAKMGPTWMKYAETKQVYVSVAQNEFNGTIFVCALEWPQSFRPRLSVWSLKISVEPLML